MKKLACVFLLLVYLVVLSGCQWRLPFQAVPTPPVSRIGGVEKYADVRDKTVHGNPPLPDRALIETLWFNEGTHWPADIASIAAEVMEAGKNPGLGVRALHEQGITGKGVNVAIIDQNLPQALEHPEFKGKIVQYYDTGTQQPTDQGSMHGPAVASLLVGENTGTAPGAQLYFVAAPSWLGDAQFYGDALNWIIDENARLPEGNKIRVVSVSAALSGPGSPFTKNNAAWDKAVEGAEQAGILVLDCGQKRIFMDATCDPADRENPAKCKPGFLGHLLPVDPTVIYVPTAYRTTAEEYSEGVLAYQYTGQGGSSWGVPYLAGVLAMGWQVRPDLTNKQIVDLLFQSAYVSPKGAHIINPPAFIKMIRALP
jgi:serine protease AprX